jgi:hypothetical protein
MCSPRYYGAGSGGARGTGLNPQNLPFNIALKSKNKWKGEEKRKKKI